MPRPAGCWLAASALGLAGCCAAAWAAAARGPAVAAGPADGRPLIEGRPAALVEYPAASGGVEFWQTALGVGQLQRLPDLTLEPDFAAPGPVVNLDQTLQDQEILGFGGAFTESSAVVFQCMTPELQDALLDQYFGSEGLAFTMGRVHINSCDFSIGSYSFDDHPGDYNLTFFDSGVTRDTNALIPFISRAKMAVERSGQALRLLASPWSPPAWMKTNGKMDGSILPGLRAECGATWALYIARWISAYRQKGLPIWAITVQNEPEASSRWEACTYTPDGEAEFLGTHLGPTMRQWHPEVAIFVHDHNKDHIYTFASASYRHPTAWQYVHGVAFHWYAGDHFQGVQAVHKDFPQATLLASEATYEKHRWRAGAVAPPEEWSFGEGYAHDIIGDLNAGANGWIDWNLLLDTGGGPNHVGNMCDAAMVAGTDTLRLHPQYYFLGHFSKFIPPGSRRVASSVQGSVTFAGATRPYGTCTAEDGLEATAFIRPDSRVAVVVLNCGDGTIDFKIRNGERALRASIPPHAIQTYILKHRM